MSYAVVWDDEAIEDVDASWDAAPEHEKEQIVAALTDIEELLHDDPLRLGESREVNEKRVFTRSPVTVHFRVHEDRKMVRVFAARVFR